MPELPDLEIYKMNLSKRLKSKRLESVSVFNFRKIIVPETYLSDELRGRELVNIDRIGKELYFDFGDEKIVSAHLMLSGRMDIVQKTDAPKVKYKLFSFNFQDESLVFSDEGGLCAVKYKPAPNNTPDALDASFTLDYFLKAVRKKPKMAIKAFLIDQKIIRGIGNAYVDEILWAARVSPRSAAGKIPDDALVTLYNSIGAVLKNAIDSIKNISGGIISGEERSFLKVHNKFITETETGHKILFERIDSKPTYYTDEQVLYL